MAAVDDDSADRLRPGPVSTCSRVATPACTATSRVWVARTTPIRSSRAFVGTRSPADAAPTTGSGVTSTTARPSAASPSATAAPVPSPRGSCTSTGPRRCTSGPMPPPRAAYSAAVRTRPSEGKGWGVGREPVARMTRGSARRRAGVISVSSSTCTPSRASSAVHQSISRPRRGWSRAAAHRSAPPSEAVRSTSRTRWPRSASVRAASRPAGPPPTTSTDRATGSRPSTGGSVLSWPALGSASSETIVLSGSRTSKWRLDSVHGLIRSGAPARTWATRSGSAISARVISTSAHRPSSRAAWAIAGSTTLPCNTTGTSADTTAHSSRLIPGGVWASGCVAPTVIAEPRTGTR